MRACIHRYVPTRHSYVFSRDWIFLSRLPNPELNRRACICGTQPAKARRKRETHKPRRPKAPKVRCEFCCASALLRLAACCEPRASRDGLGLRSRLHCVHGVRLQKPLAELVNVDCAAVVVVQLVEDVLEHLCSIWSSTVVGVLRDILHRWRILRVSSVCFIRLLGVLVFWPEPAVVSQVRLAEPRQALVRQMQDVGKGGRIKG